MADEHKVIHKYREVALRGGTATTDLDVYLIIGVIVLIWKFPLIVQTINEIITDIIKSVKASRLRKRVEKATELRVSHMNPEDRDRYIEKEKARQAFLDKLMDEAKKRRR